MLLLEISLALGFIGCLVMINQSGDLNNIELTIGMVLIWSLSSPICQTVIVSSTTCKIKELGLQQQQARMMGWMTASGSIGRIILPLIAGAFYTWHNNYADVFIFSSSIAAIAFIIPLLFRVESYYRKRRLTNS
ncbi:unnamed protein product [Adineta steineri]|uniref:Major facilitator superfamily (MFS) profile domain-containing protein n=1 Tax=Adineta steineri TaxID=433720 RepID=A0A815V2G5_9BILA|nr:unnamed protein product [Adineta steineri]